MPPHPWTVYVADAICDELEHAVHALSGEQAVDCDPPPMAERVATGSGRVERRDFVDAS